MFFEKILWKFSANSQMGNIYCKKQRIAAVLQSLLGISGRFCWMGRAFLKFLVSLCELFGVSAKPWRFRRHRTAEIARVKPRPKPEKNSGVTSAASPAFEPSFTIGNALRKARAIFRASNPKNRAFLKNYVFQKRGQIFRHRVGKFAWVSLLLLPLHSLWYIRALRHFRRHRTGENARFWETRSSLLKIALELIGFSSEGRLF